MKPMRRQHNRAKENNSKKTKKNFTGFNTEVNLKVCRNTGTAKPQDTHTKGAWLPSVQAPWFGRGRIRGWTMQKNHEPNNGKGRREGCNFPLSWSPACWAHSNANSPHHVPFFPTKEPGPRLVLVEPSWCGCPVVLECLCQGLRLRLSCNGWEHNTTTFFFFS